MSPSTDSFQEIESAVVRFAGDSGDGMQTVGERLPIPVHLLEMI